MVMVMATIIFIVPWTLILIVILFLLLLLHRHLLL
jgi:hypothetical protein